MNFSDTIWWKVLIGRARRPGGVRVARVLVEPHAVDVQRVDARVRRRSCGSRTGHPGTPSEAACTGRRTCRRRTTATGRCRGPRAARSARLNVESTPATWSIGITANSRNEPVMTPGMSGFVVWMSAIVPERISAPVFGSWYVEPLRLHQDLPDHAALPRVQAVDVVVEEHVVEHDVGIPERLDELDAGPLAGRVVLRERLGERDRLRRRVDRGDLRRLDPVGAEARGQVRAEVELRHAGQVQHVACRPGRPPSAADPRACTGGRTARTSSRR